MAPTTKLVYTPHERLTSTEHPSSYVLLVDPDAYQRYKVDSSIPLAQVVDDFSVFKYENPGLSGTVERPSKRELDEVFGTEHNDDVVRYMLEHGRPHGTGLM